MKAVNIEVGLTIVIEQCCACGVLFGLEENQRETRLKDKKDFWCPNGHSQRFTGQTEAEKLRAELDRVRARHAEEIREQNKAIAELRNGMAFGVCPVCHGEFTNLTRHIKALHPNLV